MELTRAKLHQAAGLLEKHGLDCWIIQFARETGLRSDPLEYLVGAAVTWPSAFLLNRDGRTAAIVGTGDLGQVEATGLWDEVRGYVASPRDDLVGLLDSWDPERIGVTWSESDDTADSITFGMYRMLESLLADTPYKDRLGAPADVWWAGCASRWCPRETWRARFAVASCRTRLKRSIAPSPSQNRSFRGSKRTCGLA